jgi:DNA-binding transcriptional ArsR family regulator
MRSGPDIARIAALLGDPARANMLTALLGGQSLTAGELAREAGVTAQTASGHLSRLCDGGLLVTRRQGRHAYFALSGEDVADLLESLMGLASRAGHLRTRPGPRDPALRRARVCYDHLAGEMGVDLLTRLVSRGVVDDRDGALSLGAQAPQFLESMGVELAQVRQGRRPACRACLDWSERRSHLGGALGKVMLDQICAREWAHRTPGSRVVTFSAPGLAAFRSALGPAPQAAADSRISSVLGSGPSA